MGTPFLCTRKGGEILLLVTGNNITLSKGDSASFNLTIYYADMEHPYELKDGDTIRFYMSYFDNFTHKSKIVINKLFEKNSLTLDPIDTMYLRSGRYRYEVQLTFKNGEVNTIIDASIFELSEQVMSYNINNQSKELYNTTRYPGVIQNIGQLIGVLNIGYEEVLEDEIGLKNLIDVNLDSPEENDLLVYKKDMWTNLSLQEVLEGDTIILDGGKF